MHAQSGKLRAQMCIDVIVTKVKVQVNVARVFLAFLLSCQLFDSTLRLLTGPGL
jgi:hypothetical protein